MAEDKSNKEQESSAPSNQSNDTCGNIIEKLHEEKERLENELRQEYRNVRKYVRSHPEEGLAYSFIGGLMVGFILAKIFSR